MAYSRRSILVLATGALASSGPPGHAFAAAYPTRPLHLIVGFGPGGTPDIIARLVGKSLADRLGQQVIIENKPGVGTNLATEAVVAAPPDGYNLLLIAIPPTVTSPILYHASFDVLRDVTPVAVLGRNPQLVAVNLNFPPKTVAELITYAKAHPGTINIASTGTGNLSHLSEELFMMMSGTSMVHVPYRSAAAAQADLLSGRVQLMIDTVPALIQHVKAGSVRALAVTTKTRLAILPEVPTVAEAIPGFEVTGVAGIGAPNGTPTAIVDRLNKEINSILSDPDIVARFSQMGATVITGSPVDFRMLIANETEKWTKAIRYADIKPQ